MLVLGGGGRSLAVAALFAFVPCLVSAHLIVDVGVVVSAPAFVAKSAPLAYTIEVSDLAYDPAYGIVVSDQLAPGIQFISAKGTGWTCSASKGTVSCSAETLSSGVSTITVTATALASVGPVINTARVTSLGSIDPNTANDTASAQTMIYDPDSCSIAAPAILGPPEQTTIADGRVALSWSTVSGAARYRVWSSVEGALASTLAETIATELAVEVEEGSIEWWVEAVLDTCPGATSPHAHFLSEGRPLQMSVSDYAGQPGVRGFDDGSLTAAKFVSPTSLGVDIYGNMYVADMDASTIRRIVNGTVSTITGEPGVTGSNNGTGQYGTLNHPRALAVSSGGYVYVADTGNQLIRSFYPNGNGIVFGPFLTTLAGSPGAQGTADGTGGNARFTSPSGIAVAPNYMLFVGDAGTDRVRQVGQNAVVTSVAGIATSSGANDGPANAAHFNSPTGIALDDQGNIYVADTDNNIIRRVGRDGTVTTVAGVAGVAGLTDGVGTAARFNRPTALAFDRLGNLYVADTGNHAIRRIAPSHFVSTVIGTGTSGHQNGPGATALLNTPSGIAFNSSGLLFIADAGNNVIRVATTTAPPPVTAPPRRRSAHH